ncbi:hypothetical protein NCC49_004526 [Naganishia albida]|nr:hypothetical protein NCC49_004526 [Naganishia albida]
MSDTTPSLPMNPTPNGNPAPAPAAALNHADLARILGPSFEQHLGLQPNTFLPELAVLSRAVQQRNGMDSEIIGKVVHKVRYERCKAAWSRGEVDVSAEVIARDLVDAAKEIGEETKQQPAQQAGPSCPVIQEKKKPSPPIPVSQPVNTVAGPSRPPFQETKPTCSSLNTVTAALPPLPVPTTSNQIPTTTIHTFPRNSQAHADEQFLIKSFAQRNFREYLHIAPSDIYHSNLKTLAINMVDLERTPAEVRRMLLDARDERLRKARSEKEKGKRVVQGSLKETVTSTDVRNVTVVLQREAAVVWREEHAKRKREEEEEERRLARRAKTQHPDPGKAETSAPAASSRKAKPADKPTRTPTLPTLSGPFPLARGQSSSELAQPRPTMRTAQRKTPHAQPTQRAQSVQQAPSTPSAKQAIRRASPPPSPQKPVASPRVPEAISLEPMDELMLSSFQSLATHAPRALKQGQELTLKIGTSFFCYG